MDAEKIKKILTDNLDLDEIHVQGENGYFGVIAISDKFAELSRVQQQQKIYAPLMDYIATNEIHALTIKTFTHKQWEREKLFNMPQ